MGGVYDTNSRVSYEGWNPAANTAGQISSSADAEGSISEQTLPDSETARTTKRRETAGTGQKTRPELDAHVDHVRAPFFVKIHFHCFTPIGGESLSTRWRMQDASQVATHRARCHPRKPRSATRWMRCLEDRRQSRVCAWAGRAGRFLSHVRALLAARDT